MSALYDLQSTPGMGGANVNALHDKGRACYILNTIFDAQQHAVPVPVDLVQSDGKHRILMLPFFGMNGVVCRAFNKRLLYAKHLHLWINRHACNCAVVPCLSATFQRLYLQAEPDLPQAEGDEDPQHCRENSAIAGNMREGVHP